MNYYSKMVGEVTMMLAVSWAGENAAYASIRWKERQDRLAWDQEMSVRGRHAVMLPEESRKLPNEGLVLKVDSGE
jgi:hypothetical protein